MEKVKTSSGTAVKRKKKSVVPDPCKPETRISVGKVLLNVHLWTEDGGDAPQLAMAMVNDLFSSAPGEIREESSQWTSAFFPDTVQAVRAARRLRRLVEAFSQSAKGERLGGCFVLSTAEDVGFDAETHLKQLALAVGQGHSGQVLIIGGLCEAARSIPGVRLEPIPAESLTTVTNGLYRQVMQLGPPVHMEGYAEESHDYWVPAVEARRPVPIVVEPAQFQQLPPELALPEAPMHEPVAPEPVWVEAALPEFSEEIPVTYFTPEPGLFVAAEPVKAGEAAKSSDIHWSARLPFPLRWAVLGGAAVLMVAAIAIGVSRSGGPHTPVPTSVGIPATTTQEPGDVATPRDLPPSPRAGEKPKVSGKNDKPDNGKRPEPPPPNPTIVDPRLTFSPDEINRTITRAEKQSGDGDFDAAITNYRIVLKYDPSNIRAREGLARTIKNKGKE